MGSALAAVTAQCGFVEGLVSSGTGDLSVAGIDSSKWQAGGSANESGSMDAESIGPDEYSGASSRQ